MEPGKVIGKFRDIHFKVLVLNFELVVDSRAGVRDDTESSVYLPPIPPSGAILCKCSTVS